MSDLKVRVGEPAPDFTLPDHDRRDVTLSRHQGRDYVLLAFFPLAFTGVCTDELCALSADVAEFERAGTVVYGISVDSTAALAAFRAASGITTTLLSDYHRAVSRRYGTLDEAAFFSRRAYVIVDRDGLVRWTHVERTIDDRRANAELFDALGTVRA